MKVELTEKEQRQLERSINSNPVRKFLLNRDNTNFEVGDVLVKCIRRWKGGDQYEWVNEPISSENKMSQRYVFIHKDEFGIGYMKQLKVSTGKLGSEIYCLTDYDFESTKFEVDPEYAENIFLDAEFDIKDIHKKSLEARKIITKMNRKMGIKFKTLSDSSKFFETMKAGDEFWMTSDYTAKWSQRCEIISITAHTTISLEVSSNYTWRNYKNRHTNNLNTIVDTNITYQIKYKEVSNYTRDRESFAYDFSRGMVFYKQEPAKEEKK